MSAKECCFPQNEREKSLSIQRHIHKNIFILTVPLVITLLFSVISLLYYAQQYTKQLTNVTTASAFNQSFKENIDLKMYYYITGSRYSEGLPLQEVEDAEALATDLLSTTTARDSRKAISNILELCDNLENKMIQISETESYDDQQNQLDTNIYILTSLIQEYMSNYLYYESVQLSQSHEAMIRQIHLEIMAALLLGVGALGLVTWQSLRFGKSLSQPLTALCERVREIGEGNLTLKNHEPIPTQVTEIRLLSGGFEQMVCQLKEQVQNRQKEEEQLRKTEFALLQSQINPHFLYNTLDTIIWLEEGGQTEKSIQMVTNLSSYFRTSLSKGSDIITLEEELTHVHSYLDIQQVRYQDIMDYEIHTEPELAKALIPKLTLQPLVENALYHGIKRKRGKGHIRIDCQRKEDAVCITVADNGAGISAERLVELRKILDGKQQEGFGLIAVHKRLQLLFGAAYGLTVDSTEGRGTTVTALFPFREKEYHP